MLEKMLSVGIDIGTSTTQVIFSELFLENTSGFCRIPQIVIKEKRIIYESPLHKTPLRSRTILDSEKIEILVEREYEKAGISPQEVQTGAAIITGESARKENAAVLLTRLSRMAGDFVVSTAGPDMESVVAGMGSGAREYSQKNHCRVMNLDIGGGTTNIAVFEHGNVLGTCCVDIGGRQIIVDDKEYITYISESAKKMIHFKQIALEEGKRADETEITRLADAMAEILDEITGARMSTEAWRAVKTKESSDWKSYGRLDAISFSGGVADFIYHQSLRKEKYPYGDMGCFLGERIRKSRMMSAFSLISPKETIRATVIGAGMYSTVLSGSTISCSSSKLPLKNLPVLKLNFQEEGLLDTKKSLTEKIRWFMLQNDCEEFALAMEGMRNPQYPVLCRAADILASTADQLLLADIPLIILFRQDMAKAFGQILRRKLKIPRQLVVLDSIHVGEYDHIDIGKPVMNGMAVPVVVKTLIFG